jgi:hypothetical protein
MPRRSLARGFKALGVRRTLRALGYLSVFAVLGGFLSFLVVMGVLDAINGDGSSSDRPTASPAPARRADFWAFVSYGCGDGWPSPSIGQRGACSHHGGVLSTYENATTHARVRCVREVRDRDIPAACFALPAG